MFCFLEPQQNNQPQPQLFSEFLGQKESRKGINNECEMVGPSKFGKHPAFDILVVVVVVVMVFPAGLVVEEKSGCCFAAVAVVRVCI